MCVCVSDTCALRMCAGKGAAAAIICLASGSYSGPTCELLTDRGYLACIDWLAPWPSWCDTGDSLAGFPRRARGFSRCQVYRLPGLLQLSAGLMARRVVDTPTRLTLLCWNASSVVIQTQTFTRSIFHLSATR